MKKEVKIALTLIITVALVLVVIKFKKYYDKTYVGKDYYLKVPTDQSTSIDSWKINDYVIKGKKYKFNAFNEAGEKRIVEFEITDDRKPIDNEKQLLQPNEYVKVKASQTRVIEWSIIKKEKVPAKVLEYINRSDK